MSNGHTPGPWSFRGCDGGWAIDFNEDQEQVVDYVYEEADARLIAAAPDLLEALSNLLSVYAKPDELICCSGHECGCMGASVYEQAEHYARAALAKARGTQC